MGEAKYYLSREHVEAMRAPCSEQINFSHPVLVYFKGTVQRQWNINGNAACPFSLLYGVT